MTHFRATNPRKEAQELLPASFEARVLEPSPPAINEGEYQSDDPVAIDDRNPSLLVVTPTTAGDLTWDELVVRFPHVSGFVSSHWLGVWPRLETLPEAYNETVKALAQVAFYVIAPARYEVQGKIGLRYTLGGLGTPFFGSDRQIRIENRHLVVQVGDKAEGGEITTIRQAAQMAGIEYRAAWGPDFHDPPSPIDPDAALTIDPEATAACADTLGFGFSVLEQIRAEAPDDEMPTRVQLWPEHFDAAVEIGIEGAGRRAGFGVSPGYAAHPEPYVYVSPWTKDWLSDPYWNADFFGGSILRYSELLQAENQRETALTFLRTGLELIRAR